MDFLLIHIYYIYNNYIYIIYNVLIVYIMSSSLSLISYAIMLYMFQLSHFDPELYPLFSFNTEAGWMSSILRACQSPYNCLTLTRKTRSNGAEECQSSPKHLTILCFVRAQLNHSVRSAATEYVTSHNICLRTCIPWLQ